eukprot:5346369-Pleurochrysis_carterae.AAC.2
MQTTDARMPIISQAVRHEEQKVRKSTLQMAVPTVSERHTRRPMSKSAQVDLEGAFQTCRNERQQGIRCVHASGRADCAIRHSAAIGSGDKGRLTKRGRYASALPTVAWKQRQRVSKAGATLRLAQHEQREHGQRRRRCSAAAAALRALGDKRSAERTGLGACACSALMRSASACCRRSSFRSCTSRTREAWSRSSDARAHGGQRASGVYRAGKPPSLHRTLCSTNSSLSPSAKVVEFHCLRLASAYAFLLHSRSPEDLVSSRGALMPIQQAG